MSGEATGSANVAGGGSTPATGGPVGGSAPSATPVATSGGTGQPGSTPGTPAVSATPAEKKYKIRVAGKEVEATRADLLAELEKEVGEDGVLDLVKLRKGSYQRFEDAKKANTQLEQFNKLLQNPNAVFEELARRHGPDRAAAIIAQQHQQIEQYRKMTPEQRQRWQEHQQYLADKRQVAEHKKQLEATERKAQAEKAAGVIRERFTQALTGLELPVNQQTIARMAIIAKDRMARGLPHEDHVEIAREVKTQMQAELRGLVKGLNPQQLREFLGDDHIKTIRQMQIEALQSQGPKPSIAQPRGDDGKFVPVKGKVNGQEPAGPTRKPVRQWLREQRAQRMADDAKRGT